MTVFQKVYNWVAGWTLSTWLQELLENLTNNVVFPVIKAIGKEAYDYLVAEIIKQSQNDVAGTIKIHNVFKGFREIFFDIAITDYALNLAIELIVSMLKINDEI